MTQLEICNLALDKLGEPPITSIGASTPAAQACTRLYQPTLDRLVRKYRWNFARASVVLEPVWSQCFLAPTLMTEDGVWKLTAAGGTLNTVEGDRILIRNSGVDGLDGYWVLEEENPGTYILVDSSQESYVEPDASVEFHIAPIHTWEYRILLPADCLALRTVEGYEVGRPHQFFNLEGRYILCNLDEIDVTYTKKQTGGTDEANFDTVFNDLFATLLAAELAMPVTGAMSRKGDMMALYQEELNAALMSNVFEHRDNLIDQTQGPTSWMARNYA